MNVVTSGKWALGALDALALASLYSTAEIRVEAGMLVLAIFLVRSLRVRIRSLGLQFSLVFAIVALGAFAALKFHVYPILAAAHVGTLVHALLWLGGDEARDRVLRLSLGFVNLSLASALTADFYLFGSIFAFAILGSVYVSLGFLESAFRARVPELLHQPLPRGYLRNMLTVSLSVFVISILLFPVIPRTSWKRDDGGSSYFNVGYADTVDLLTSAQSTLKTSTRVALRIFSQNPDLLEEPERAIPMGMLIGQPLDLFDGARWLPRMVRGARGPETRPAPSAYEKTQFEVIREAHVKSVAFRPYGSRVLERSSVAGRSRYVYAVTSTETVDPPDETDLAVPQAARSQKLEELSRRILGRASSNAEKAKALAEHFRSGFSGSLLSTQHERTPAAVLERFLLEGKSGNCELFASSGALLLRLARVPSRVVAGYRVLRPSRGGQLTVLDGDAHAWIEYWSDARGWMPLDLTPRSLTEVGWLDSVQGLYWAAEGAWYRWLVGFRKDTEEDGVEPAAAAPKPEAGSWDSWATRYFSRLVKGRERGLTVIALLLVLLLAARMALGTLSSAELRQMFRSGASWSRRRLHFEYLRYQRIARRARAPSASTLEVSGQWRELYLRLRFGRPEPEGFAESLRRLGELRRRYKRDLRLTPRASRPPAPIP